jgi:hypothetical protein
MSTMKALRIASHQINSARIEATVVIRSGWRKPSQGIRSPEKQIE